MNIKELNSSTYIALKALDRNDLSNPLLVSPKLKNKTNKVMYIGQETNTWFKDDGNLTREQLEDNYFDFLCDVPYKSTFWNFINGIIANADLEQDLIWANCFVCGKKEGRGTPIANLELIDISVNYLCGLYEIFKPKRILICSGNKYPYFIVIEAFLKKIGICDEQISKVNMRCNLKIFELKTSDNLTIVYWTYHPNYLKRIKMYTSVTDILKNKF